MIADPRHVGIIITAINYGAAGDTCTVRWEETGWLSFRLPLADMRPVGADS